LHAGDWHLGRRYFVLHLRQVPPAQLYEPFAFVKV